MKPNVSQWLLFQPHSDPVHASNHRLKIKHWYSQSYAMFYNPINSFKCHLHIIWHEHFPSSILTVCFEPTVVNPCWDLCVETKLNPAWNSVHSINEPLIEWPTVPPNVQEVNLYYREILLMTKDRVRWSWAMCFTSRLLPDTFECHYDA